MTWYIARITPSNKVMSVNDSNGMSEIYRLVDNGWTIYRIEAAGGGTFTLVPQELTGVTTDSVTTGGTLQDVP